MASPLDKLQSAFKSSQGQIAQGSTEELSAQLGQSSVPKDPASALALGATPQQAAMSGSKASLRATIRQNMDLGAQQRQGQGVPQDQAAADKAKQEAAALTQSMGNLDSRVQQLVQAKVGNPQAEKEAALKVSSSALDAVPQQNRAALEPLLGKLGAGTATPTDILNINKLMGKTTQADMLDAATLQKQFLQGEQQIGQALAAGVGNALKVSELNIDSLGMGSKADIANRLGVSVADVDNMTASQFMESLHTYQQRELTRTNSLQQRANDPLLGQAERQQARQELRGAGATGLRSAEESVADLQDQINTANTVSFGGQNMSVEKLMSDENMSNMVASYLRDPSSESSRELAKTEPGLVDWINQNKQGLDKLSQGVSQQAQQFADIQMQTKKLASPEGMPALSDDTMKALMPEWGQLTDKVPQAPAALQILHDPAANFTEKQAIHETLTSLTNLGPSYVTELRDMSHQDLRLLGLTEPGAAKAYVGYVKDSKNIGTANPEPKALLGAVGLDVAQADAKLQELRYQKTMGIGEDAGPLSSILDPDGDGHVNTQDMARIKEQLKGLMGGGTMSLSQMLQAGKRVDSMPTLASLGTGVGAKALSGDTKTLYDAVRSGLQDGDFNGKEAEEAARNLGNDVSKLAKLANMMRNSRDAGGVRGDGADKLTEIGTNKATDNYKKRIFPTSLKGNDGQEYGHWGNRARSGQVLPDNVRGDMEKAVAALRSQKPANYMEENARNNLLGSLENTLKLSSINQNQKNAEEAKKAREAAEAASRRVTEAQKPENQEIARIRAELAKNISSGRDYNAMVARLRQLGAEP